MTPASVSEQPVLKGCITTFFCDTAVSATEQPGLAARGGDPDDDEELGTGPSQAAHHCARGTAQL